MSEDDRLRWDARYSAAADPLEPAAPEAPPLLAPFERLFPRAGLALDVACGPGAASVWLAGLGLEVWGWDISPVAVARARALADRSGMGDRCRFLEVDLDGGLPATPPADVVLCHLFRDPRLDRPIVERLKEGGLLAIVVLSEVGDRPGPFRARPGELTTAFSRLSVLASGEKEGRAWLLARK